MLIAALVSFSTLLVVGTWLTVESLIALAHEHALDDARTRNAALSLTLQEHAEQTFQQIDRLVLAIGQRYQAEGEHLDLPRLFDALRVNLDVIFIAALVDDRGMAFKSSNNAPPVSLADREHIIIHLENDTQDLFLGKPTLARLTGQWSWPVTRRVNKADGTLLGVVAVLHNPNYFSDFYRRLHLGTDTTIALVGQDGVVRTLMHPGATGAGTEIGVDLSRGELFRHYSQTPRGSFVAPDPTDGVTRIYAYEGVDSFPLISEVGTSLSEALAEYSELARIYRGAGAAVTLIVLLAAGGLCVLIRREAGAAANLERLVVERTESLRQSQQQLFEAEKMEAVGRLAGGMAHDLNNYLSIIVGNLDLLKMHAADHGETSNLTDGAMTGAMRAADMMKSLLSFAGRQPLNPNRTDVGELVAKLGGMLRATLGADIAVTMDCAPDTWPVYIDAERLDSCLVNLLTNAGEAMPDGGRLTLSTYNRTIDAAAAEGIGDIAPGDYIVVEVADSGAGMTPEVLAQAFEPFFSTKPVGHGIGLGLSMVLGFAKQSGGNITLDSTPGTGTVVRLYLPRDREV